MAFVLDRESVLLANTATEWIELVWICMKLTAIHVRTLCLYQLLMFFDPLFKELILLVCIITNELGSKDPNKYLENPGLKMTDLTLYIHSNILN